MSWEFSPPVPPMPRQFNADLHEAQGRPEKGHLHYGSCIQHRETYIKGHVYCVDYYDTGWQEHWDRKMRRYEREGTIVDGVYYAPDWDEETGPDLSVVPYRLPWEKGWTGEFVKLRGKAHKKGPDAPHQTQFAMAKDSQTGPNQKPLSKYTKIIRKFRESQSNSVSDDSSEVTGRVISVPLFGDDWFEILEGLKIEYDEQPKLDFDKWPGSE